MVGQGELGERSSFVISCSVVDWWRCWRGVSHKMENDDDEKRYEIVDPGGIPVFYGPLFSGASLHVDGWHG